MKKNVFKAVALASICGLVIVSTASLAATKKISASKFTGVITAVGANPVAMGVNGVMFAPYQIRIDNDSNYALQAGVVGTSFSRAIAAGDALSVKNNIPVGGAEISLTENGQQFFDQQVYNHSCVEVYSGINVQVIPDCLQ